MINKECPYITGETYRKMFYIDIKPRKYGMLVYILKNPLAASALRFKESVVEFTDFERYSMD